MDIPLTPGTLSQDCYPASAQAFYNEMFARGKGTAPDLVELLVQDAAPDPADRGKKGWIPTAGGVPIYPGYVFIWHAVVGHWVARHPKGPNDPRPEPYFGDVGVLPTFDGGGAGPLDGAATGPMWVLWTAVDGRVLVGAGTIPDSSGVTIANGATQDSTGAKGEYKHVLTGAEGGIGNHVHPIGNGDVGSGDIGLAFTTPALTTPTYTAFGVHGAGPIGLPTTSANLVSLPANDGNGVVSDGHLNMQPYLGIYWIKRTAREFYLAG